MSHEPTEEEVEAALAKTAAGYSLRNALTAANAIRDTRIRAEALEEAAAENRRIAALYRQGNGPGSSAAIVLEDAAIIIRALEDKTDE